METLQLLGVALGLAALSGINLYLTVFVTGLAVRMEWIKLAPHYEPLTVLADPVIITIAGVFFLFEFFADKVPWVDSMWDAVHTVIRPVGAAFLAITVLGEPSPVFDVVVGLLAGGTALTTHAAKATGRLVVNASPEPFSNIGLSLAEDGAVVGGLFLLAWNPVVALVVVILAIASIWFFAPRVWRLFRSRALFAWKKLTAPAESARQEIPAQAPVGVDCALHKICDGAVRVKWCLPATVGKVPGIPANVPGFLVLATGENPRLFWAGRVFFRLRVVEVSQWMDKFEYRSGFLFDTLTIYNPAAQKRMRLLIDRSVSSRLRNLLGENDPFARATESKSVVEGTSALLQSEAGAGKPIEATGSA